MAVPQSGPQALVERRGRESAEEAAISLTSVCFLFAVKGKGDNPFIRTGMEVKEEASLHDSQLHL